MGCTADPNANTRHTDNCVCVVTPNLLREPDPRQSLVERLWKRNCNSAMVMWINRPLTLKMETQQQTLQIAVK